MVNPGLPNPKLLKEGSQDSGLGLMRPSGQNRRGVVRDEALVS